MLLFAAEEGWDEDLQCDSGGGSACQEPETRCGQSLRLLPDKYELHSLLFMCAMFTSSLSVMAWFFFFFLVLFSGDEAVTEYTSPCAESKLHV